jgi:CRISPR/Cas system-associated exonuclease Cas4 (RecB family)
MSIYISASGISDFIRCPQKLLYRFTKPFPEIPSREMIIGKVVHSAIERGWKDRNGAIEYARTASAYNKLTSKELSNVEFFLDIFFLNFRGLVKDGDKVEYSFKIPLYDDVLLVGKMDRISSGNIIDWKTTAKPPKRLDNDVQCVIYEYAYSVLFNKKPSSICVASLSTGKLIPYTRNDSYVDEIFNRVIPNLIKTVKNESYEKIGIFNGSCPKCQYRKGCLSDKESNVVDSA